MPRSSMKIEVVPLELPLVTKGMDVAKLIMESAKLSRIGLEDGDIVAAADKVLAVSEGRVVDYSNVKPSSRARLLAKKHDLEPGFTEVVVQESDTIYGGVHRAMLTLKHGVFIANAGIDHKNVPKDCASLWPEDPNESAKRLRQSLQTMTRKRLGVLLVDSHLAPLRTGTIGFALGVAGFEPIRDCRGLPDLYGKPLLITTINVADSLASMANFAMGETAESTPAAVIRGAEVTVTDEYDPLSVRIPVENDIFSVIFGVSRNGSSK